MSKSVNRRLVGTLIILDSIGVALALLVAYWLRIVSGLLPERAFEEFAVYLRVSALIVPIFLLIFAFNNLYDARLMRGGMEEYARIAKSFIYGIVAVILLSYWVRVATLSRGWFLLIFVFGLLFVGGGRFLVRRALAWIHRRGRLRTRMLIVGANEQGQAIARQFRAAAGAGIDVIGFIDDFLPVGAPVPMPDQPDAPLRVLGGPDRLHDVARQHQVDEVVLVSNAVAWETFQEIMQRLSVDADQAPFEIKLSPGFYEILTTGVQVTQVAYVPLLLVNRERITGPDKLLKNSLDYSLAALNLVVAAPLMGLIALVLRLTTPGPVIERHRVLARGGGEFTTWKFNTGLGETPRPRFAHPLALAGGGQATAGAAQKITRVQRFLYDSGLDKMPQLLNILAGEMSWVGPRTVSVGQVELHSPWLSNLLTVKPGITGPWAVGWKRTLDDEMRLTMVYIRNWTIWLDLQILGQTALRVLRLERDKARLPER
ncbi:MAG TPA: sugar transferase [Anaerolineae bacterium]|nr:sugar transferase [Anaerolineae bacterium]HNU04079.1 sugar transferase [Anaerolineae bacterium]